MKLSEQITRRQLFVAFGTSQQTGGLSSVDLAAIRDGASVTLTASDGSVAPISGADTSQAGVMTAGDKAKLDALPPTTTREFGARAAIAGTSVGAAITQLRTAGYASTGDGGGALYRRVGAEPSHPFKVRSADGAWWEGVPDPAGVSVRQFGAVGDGATDDSAAIQDAVVWARSASETTPLHSTRIVRVPKGTYVLGSRVALYSGVHLKGEGEMSRLKAIAGFAGDRLLEPTGINYAYECNVSDLGFEGGSIWAIKNSAPNGWLNSRVENIWLNIGYGLSAGPYMQASRIDGVYSTGNIDQLLHIRGNHLEIHRIDKENNTGTSADPYVLIENHGLGLGVSEQIRIGRILLEGTGSANKVPLKIVGCTQVLIDQYWFECTTTNGYCLHIENCGREVRVNTSPINVDSVKGRIKIVNSDFVRFGSLDLNAEDLNGLETWLDVDAGSWVHIDHLVSRRAADINKLALGRNVSVGYTTIAELLDAADRSPRAWGDNFSGANLVRNGSFEAGSYGWSFAWGNPTTESYVTSKFAAGLMAELQWSDGGTKQVTQQIAVPAELVGRELTLRVMVELTGAGYAGILTSGAGIADNTGSVCRANAGEGPQILTLTVIPQSAGTLNFGLWFIGLTASSVVRVDEVTLAYGARALLGVTRLETVELGGRTHVVGSAAPTTGTWKAGDIVWNGAPASGGAVGWVCVAAGAPGTWKTFGSIAA